MLLYVVCYFVSYNWPFFVYYHNLLIGRQMFKTIKGFEPWTSKAGSHYYNICATHTQTYASRRFIVTDVINWLNIEGLVALYQS